MGAAKVVDLEEFRRRRVERDRDSVRPAPVVLAPVVWYPVWVWMPVW